MIWLENQWDDEPEPDLPLTAVSGFMSRGFGNIVVNFGRQSGKTAKQAEATLKGFHLMGSVIDEANDRLAKTFLSISHTFTTSLSSHGETDNSPYRENKPHSMSPHGGQVYDRRGRKRY